MVTKNIKCLDFFYNDDRWLLKFQCNQFQQIKDAFISFQLGSQKMLPQVGVAELGEIPCGAGCCCKTLSISSQDFFSRKEILRMALVCDTKFGNHVQKSCNWYCITNTNSLLVLAKLFSCTVCCMSFISRTLAFLKAFSVSM